MIVAAPSFERTILEYCDMVRSGQRIAGRLERCAVERYLLDRTRIDEDPDCPYTFNEKKANDACEFFNLLKHTDGEYAGKPFSLYPWQAFVIWNLFGFVEKETGYRRYREAFISVARGNGKTPFGAAILLKLFKFDDPPEPRAECYTVAVKRDQARFSFDACRRFISQWGEMGKSLFKLEKNVVTTWEGDSKLEPLASEAKSLDGLVIHGVLRDELHAWEHYQRESYQKIQTALAKRRQPLAITITTAGSEQSEIWLEQYHIARQVVDPASPYVIDSLFVFIAEIDDDDDPLDEQCWAKANPMLEYGIVKISALRDLAMKARTSESIKHELKRYHCNKMAFSHCKSFEPTEWAKGNQPIPDKIRDIFCGVDLGWCDDFAAIGYVAPLDWVSVEGQSKRRYAVWTDVTIPRGTARDLHAEPFATWIKSGKVKVTHSQWTDTEPLYRAIAAISKKHKIKSLAYDPANAREFAVNMENVYKVKTYPFPQAHAKYNEALLEFKIALSEGRILHGGDPVLGWAALNVVEDENAKGLRMPAKGRSIDKIDPFVSVLMAFSECLYSERTKPSKYERSGPIFAG